MYVYAFEHCSKNLPTMFNNKSLFKHAYQFYHFKSINCFIRVYSNLGIHVTNYSTEMFSAILPIMLALCLMLSGTYYAKSYAGIIHLT